MVKEITYRVEEEIRINVILIRVNNDIISVIGSIMLVNSISEYLELNIVIVIKVRIDKVII